MPVYNGQDFLRKSIESVLAQTYIEWEMFCVDDCSTDDSYAILCDFAKKDGRIRVIRKEKNGGSVPKSWNFIIGRLDGDFVQYLTQDDLLEPDYFEKQIDCYHKTGADWIVARYSSYDYTTGKKHVDAIKGGKCMLGKVISGERAFVLSLDWSISGFGLTKRELYDGVVWDTTFFNSDDLVCKTMFYKCPKVAFGSGVYYRGNNPNAITSIPKPYQLHTIATEFELLRIIRYEYKMNEAVAQWQLCHIILMLRRLLYFLRKYGHKWEDKEREWAVSSYREGLKSISKKEVVNMLFRHNLSFYKLYIGIKKRQLGNIVFLKGFVYKLRAVLVLLDVRKEFEKF